MGYNLQPQPKPNPRLQHTHTHTLTHTTGRERSNWPNLSSSRSGFLRRSYFVWFREIGRLSLQFGRTAIKLMNITSAMAPTTDIHRITVFSVFEWSNKSYQLCTKLPLSHTFSTTNFKCPYFKFTIVNSFKLRNVTKINVTVANLIPCLRLTETRRHCWFLPNVRHFQNSILCMAYFDPLTLQHWDQSWLA